MALWQATQCLYPGPIPMLLNADGANDLVPMFGDFVVPAALAVNDVVEMVGIPPGYVPVDLIAAFEAIGSTATVDIGLITGNYGALLDVAGAARVCTNEAIAAANVATPGIVRPTKKDFCLIAPITGDPNTTPRTTGERGVGFKVLAGLVGLVTGAKVRFTIYVRPMIAGA